MASGAGHGGGMRPKPEADTASALSEDQSPRPPGRAPVVGQDPSRTDQAGGSEGRDDLASDALVDEEGRGCS